MDPALMFGMINDEDEDDFDEADLSGWMSRSPPSLGNIEEPMITERPRARASTGATDMNAAAAAISAPTESYTYRPRSNPNMGYVASGVGSENVLNPFYAHDEALFDPRVAVASKVAGIAIIGGALIARAAVAKHEGFKFPTKRVIAGTALYAHPVLGWNHGALAMRIGSGTGGKIAKGAAHIVGAAAFVTLLRRF